MIARVLALSSMFVGVMARRADLNDCFETTRPPSQKTGEQRLQLDNR